MTLEGGYDVEGERDAIKEVLMEMADFSHARPDEVAATTDRQFLEVITQYVREAHRSFWKSL